MHRLLTCFFATAGMLLVTLLFSCGPSTNAALRQEIAGEGRLHLDTSNPYLAPNKFLSEEAKASETLKGFLSLKGAPQEIEYEQPLIIGTSSLSLFYSDEGEKYVLKQSTGDWIITGPFALTKKKA